MDQPRRARDAPAADPRDRPRRHDQTYKLLFSHPTAARSLIRDALARDWSGELDLETLERFPTEHVDAGLRRSMGDMAWRVGFKGRKRSAVFLVEFQSSSDKNMALRIQQYASATAMFLQTNPEHLDADGFMPLLVAYELYTGPGRSTAKRSVAELCKLPKVPTAARGRIGRFPSHDYVGVDLQWMQGEGLLAHDTVMEWVGALEREPMASLPRVHASLEKHWGDSEHREFRGALAKWTGERMRAIGATREAREQIEEQIVNPRERPNMTQTWQEWLDANSAEAIAKGVAEGVAKGVAEAEAKAKAKAEAKAEAKAKAKVAALMQALARAGAEGDARQRRLVVRQASRRFGAETGERLAQLVEPMGADELACVGDAVVDCGTGDELLARASNGVSTAPPA